MRHHWTIIIPLLVLALAGCQTVAGGSPTPDEEPFVMTDNPGQLGREHFARGEYGLAQRYFQTAVERAPNDGSAWIGLAASYDQLGRFDLADRAYDQAGRLNGQTVQILNNRGFSYLLRGNARQADVMFARARAADPGNRYIANNIQILRAAIE